MTSLIKSKYSWLTAPIIFLIGVAVIALLCGTHSSEWILSHFDSDGGSPVESVTVGLFYLCIGFIWLVPCMRPSKTRLLWRLDFTLINLIAICRELDWHKAVVHASQLPGATPGSAFKLRFLTNSANPLGDRILVLLYFIIVFSVVGGTILFFIKRLWKGLWKLHPVCWTIGFLGGTGVLVQFLDRTPSILRRKFDYLVSPQVGSTFAAFEEGFELFLPVFAILAILQAYMIYVNSQEDGTSLEKWSSI